MNGTRTAKLSGRGVTIAVACLMLAAFAASFLPGRKDGEAFRPGPDDGTGGASADTLTPSPAARQAATNADAAVSTHEPAPASAPPAPVDRDAAIAAALQRMRDAEEPAETEPAAVPAPIKPPEFAVTLEPAERESLEAKALAD